MGTAVRPMHCEAIATSRQVERRKNRIGRIMAEPIWIVATVISITVAAWTQR